MLRSWSRSRAMLELLRFVSGECWNVQKGSQSGWYKQPSDLETCARAQCHYHTSMSNVAKHYEQLLAEHYVWMFGVPFEHKVAEQKSLLERIVSSIPSALQRGAAIDLGSGPGFQTIALAELGYAPVIAVDTSDELLTELRAHSG